MHGLFPPLRETPSLISLILGGHGSVVLPDPSSILIKTSYLKMNAHLGREDSI